MSQSLSKIYIHLIFSTKRRKPMILKTFKVDLHSFMAGVFKKHGSPAIIINSVPDHIHILFRMSKKVALSTIVEDIKKSSSKWVKEQTGNHSFFWQTGYGAFSVSHKQIDTVTQYIAHQEEHHKHMSFREEIEMIMKEYDVVEYDPEFFWN